MRQHFRDEQTALKYLCSQAFRLCCIVVVIASIGCSSSQRVQRLGGATASAPQVSSKALPPSTESDSNRYSIENNSSESNSNQVTITVASFSQTLSDAPSDALFSGNPPDVPDTPSNAANKDNNDSDAESSESTSIARPDLVREAVQPELERDAIVYPITLNQAIYASITQHPTVRSELELISQARADFLTASLFPNPDLSTGIALLPLTEPFTVDRQGGPPQLDAILSVPLDWFLFGKRTAAISSAHYGIHQTQAEYQNIIRERVLETAVAFFDAIEAKHLNQLAKQNVESFLQLEKATLRSVEAGGRPAIEANRVKLDLISAQQGLRTSSAQYATALLELQKLMGAVDLPGEISLLWQMDEPISDQAVDSEEAVQLAISNRPDVQAKLWRRSQASAEIVVERRAAKPQVSSSWGYTRQFQEKALGFPDVNAWGTAVDMSLPIGDRNQGNIAKASSELSRAQRDYEAALIAIEVEVAQRIIELEAARDNANSVAREQIELAEAVRDSIRDSFLAGGRPLIDVLDAQRNYLNTNALLISSRSEYWRALYRYYAAIGQAEARD